MKRTVLYFSSLGDHLCKNMGVHWNSVCIHVTFAIPGDNLSEQQWSAHLRLHAVSYVHLSASHDLDHLVNKQFAPCWNAAWWPGYCVNIALSWLCTMRGRVSRCSFLGFRISNYVASRTTSRVRDVLLHDVWTCSARKRGAQGLCHTTAGNTVQRVPWPSSYLVTRHLQSSTIYGTSIRHRVYFLQDRLHRYHSISVLHYQVISKWRFEQCFYCSLTFRQSPWKQFIVMWDNSLLDITTKIDFVRFYHQYGVGTPRKEWAWLG